MRAFLEMMFQLYKPCLLGISSRLTTLNFRLTIVIVYRILILIWYHIAFIKIRCY